MSSAHLVIPDLFLPQDIAADACAGLALPAMETLLARAQAQPLPEESLEDWLCGAFGLTDRAIAAVTLQAEGVRPETAYWLRADPVHLSLQREQLILHPGVAPDAGEAEQLCASLNAHFEPRGMRFIAPHPQRWYLQLADAPDIDTHPLAQVEGCNVYEHMPQGRDALRWHGIFNEIQMLLHAHPVNEAREARGGLSINSVWLWGGGRAGAKLLQPWARMYGDSTLASAFAQAAHIPCSTMADDVAASCIAGADGDFAVVCEGMRRAYQRGDVLAWRDELLRIERCCTRPLLAAVRTGRIARLTLDALQAGASQRFMLTRGAAWKFWRRSDPLPAYALR